MPVMYREERFPDSAIGQAGLWSSMTPAEQATKRAQQAAFRATQNKCLEAIAAIRASRNSLELYEADPGFDASSLETALDAVIAALG